MESDLRPRLCLFGTPSVETGTTLSPLMLAPKTMALLARVAVGGTAVRRSELARLLFDEADDARGALRWQLSQLRSRLPTGLGICLRLEGSTVRLDADTDVELFRDRAPLLLKHPDHPDGPVILGLYRGDLCEGLAVSAGVAFDTWLYVEQERLRQTFRRTCEAFASAAIRSGRAEQALEPLARLIAVDPYFEEAHVLLIRAHEAAHDPHRAREAYDRYQHTVRTELHAEPRPAMVAGYEGGRRAGKSLPREDMVSLHRVTLHILDWPGEEPAILGIHGSAGCAYSLTALGERLAPSARFVSVDLRGHGFSDKPSAGYGIDQHAADLVELIGALDLRQPVVLGHSLGAAVATLLARRVNAGGLVLLDGVVGDGAFPENAAAVVKGWGAELESRRFGGFAEYLEHWHSESRGTYAGEPEQWIERYARYALARLPDGTYRNRALRQALEEEWASVLAADGLAELRRVRCPVLVVHAQRPWLGGRPYLEGDVIRSQMKAARDARLVVAEHSDHETLIRDPDPRVVDAIRALAQPRTRRRAAG